MLPARSGSYRRAAAFAGAAAVFVGGAVAASATAAGSGTVTITVGGPAKTYAGGPVVGNADPLGPPAPNCAPTQCDRQLVHIAAPTPALPHTRQINLTARVTFSGAGNTLDIGILDSKGTLIASTFAVGSGGALTASNVHPGNYTIEVDGDIAATPQSFTGHVKATNVKRYIPPVRHPGHLSFGRETLTDPFRLGTEPNLALDPDGKTVYTSPIFGSSTTQSFLERSTDGGRTFHTLGTPGVGKLDECGGGGDSDVATDSFSGDVYMVDLATEPEVPARASHDKGLSFDSNCQANQEQGPNYFTDRQWLSVDRKHHLLWYIYRDGVLDPGLHGGAGGIDADKHLYGEYLKYAPLPSKAHQAGSKQTHFKSLCKDSSSTAAVCIQAVQIAGNAISDNSPKSPRYGTTYLPMETSKGITIASFNPSGAKSVKLHVAAPGKHQILFPTAAVDRTGTVYLAWTDSVTNQVMLVHSKGSLNKWSKPVFVNGKPVNVTVMPWVVAGDGGRVDIAFYGTHNDRAPSNNYGPWYPYLDQTLDARRAHPHFHQVRMTARPNHIDPVCLNGLGCTTDTSPAGDRELGDFFKPAINAKGRLLVAYADGDDQLGKEVANGPVPAPSFADIVVQRSGASLFRKVGKLSVAARPTNCVSRAKHAVRVPYDFPKSGKQGASVPALELRGSCLTDPRHGKLTATFRLQTLNPSAATSTAGGPVATYLVRWVYHHHVYAAGAEVSGGHWSYFAGPSSPVTDGIAIKYAYYPASSTITGHIAAKKKTITLKIPAAAVGKPTARARLSTVTAFSYVHAEPTAAAPPDAGNYDLPQVGDVLPAYDVVARHKASAHRSAVAAASVQPTLPASNLWRDAVAVLCALAALACLAAAAASVGQTPYRRLRAP
jgi:hypothetical protein